MTDTQRPSQSEVPPIGNHVSDISLRLLLWELLTLLNESKEGESAVSLRLEERGFDVGARLAELLSMTKPGNAFGTQSSSTAKDRNNLMKFLCKEVWNYLFLKQADRLQSDRRGGFIVYDSNFRWLVSLSCHDDPEQKTASNIAHLLLAYPAGIFRGVLTTLGYPCAVLVKEISGTQCVFRVHPVDEQGNALMPAEGSKDVSTSGHLSTN